jgi:hypothetical protein
MAPRKQQRQNIKLNFLDSVTQLDLNAADELSEAQLMSAYGLTRVGPQPQSDRTSQSFECQSSTSPIAQPNRHSSPVASTSKLSPERAPVPVIDLASGPTSEDDLIIVTAKPTTRTTYKTRPKPPIKSITDCSHDNCKHNPLCTAWLGQNKWEDTGRSNPPPLGPALGLGRSSASEPNAG